MSVANSLSGILINQNAPALVNDEFLLYPLDNNWVYQDFILPDDYQRGVDTDEIRLPDISGIQVFLQMDESIDVYVGVDFVLQHQIFGVGWQTVAEGVITGRTVTDAAWLTSYFDETISVGLADLVDRFRIGIRGRSGGWDDLDQPATYDGTYIVAGGYKVAALGVGTEPYPFTLNGYPAVLIWDAGAKEYRYSIQQNPLGWIASSPNPLAPTNSKAYGSNGTTPLNIQGSEFSFCFRLLGLSGDEGIDFLGNRYRSVVARNEVRDMDTVESSSTRYWMSRPYPSKFAVESVYFDIRQDGGKSVIDQVLVDPITPGVYFNVYYSSEGEAGVTEADWENKLWTHVPITFRAVSREAHRLPEPIGSKYIKLEFSHLQAKYYAPGTFQAPITYKKYPKWVLDYFLVRLASPSNPGGTVNAATNVIFDAIDLAYNYYLDDLKETPTDLSSVTNFLLDRSDTSDRVDPVTLSKIKLAMAPYQSHPALHSDPDTLLGSQIRSLIYSLGDYPTETPIDTSLTTQDVSVLNRESIIVEQNFPVMFFYLTCRHAYRVVQASLESDRAYFVGIRELAFLRDNYLSEFDTSLYIEGNSDLLNVERNDFVVEE
jgi:hypothetical protein